MNFLHQVKRQSVSASGSATGSSLTVSPPSQTPSSTATSSSQSATTSATSIMSSVSSTQSSVASTSSALSSIAASTSSPPISSGSASSSSDSSTPSSSASSSPPPSGDASTSIPSSTPPSSTPPSSTPPSSTPPSSTPPSSTPPSSTPSSTPPSSTPPSSTPPSSTPPSSSPSSTSSSSPSSTTSNAPPYSSSPTSSTVTVTATTTSQASYTTDSVRTSPPASPLVVVSSATITLHSTEYLTYTNSAGQVTTSAPGTFTQTVVSTNSNGQTIVVTQVVSNPTLSPDNTPMKSNAFFRDKGAVAGVFLIVGLAAASTCLFFFFLARRRRKTRKLDHDAAVNRSLAAAGFNRAPLDEDDDEKEDRRHTMGSEMEMGRYSSGVGTVTSLPLSAGRPPSGYLDDPPSGSPGHEDRRFDPYAVYAAAGPEGYRPSRDGYAPARNSSPVLGGDGRPLGHSASYSAGSTEPLLAAMHGSSPFDDVPPPPPRNPKRLIDRQASQEPSEENIVLPYDRNSSGYSTDALSDDRLNPVMGDRLKGGTSIKDNVDYSRPVLEVRNIADDVSNGS